MTVFEWQAARIERAGSALAYWAECTPDDRREWKPDVPGARGVRSVNEQIQECIGLNRAFAAALRGEERKPREEYAPVGCGAGADGLQMLRESAGELAAAVRRMTEADLARRYDMGFAPLPGSVVLELGLGNMSYHGGQVNLIQMLYGDAEFHAPPGFING